MQVCNACAVNCPCMHVFMHAWLSDCIGGYDADKALQICKYNDNYNMFSLLPPFQ